MPSNRKRLGYPTQKPEALLQQVILASSNEGDLVLDPFCGCGTTLTSAQEHKRNWIGIDISPTAIDICDRRLQLTGAEAIKYGMPSNLADLEAMSHYEFQVWICHQIGATPSPSYEWRPWRRWAHDRLQRPGAGQADENRSPRRGQLPNGFSAREGHARGVMVGYSFSREAREERARAERDNGIEIDFHRAEEGWSEGSHRPDRPAGVGQFSRLEDLGHRDPKEKPGASELVLSELRARRERTAS